MILSDSLWEAWLWEKTERAFLPLFRKWAGPAGLLMQSSLALQISFFKVALAEAAFTEKDLL